MHLYREAKHISFRKYFGIISKLPALLRSSASHHDLSSGEQSCSQPGSGVSGQAALSPCRRQVLDREPVGLQAPPFGLVVFTEWRCLRCSQLGCGSCLHSGATPAMAGPRGSGVVAEVGFSPGKQNVKAEAPQVDVILKVGLSIVPFSL